MKQSNKHTTHHGNARPWSPERRARYEAKRAEQRNGQYVNAQLAVNLLDPKEEAMCICQIYDGLQALSKPGRQYVMAKLAEIT